MGGLMEPLLKIAAKQAAEKAATEATAKAEKRTLLDNIRNLMETTKWTAQQAMNALKIPADKQKEYAVLI